MDAMELINNLRECLVTARQAIVDNNNGQFAQSTSEALLLSAFIDSSLRDKLYDTIINTCFSLQDMESQGDSSGRVEIARLFFEEGISLCKSYMH